MYVKSLALFALLGNASARLAEPTMADGSAHLDLEIVSADGQRELFPLLPGVKCPTGHICRERVAQKGINPIVPAIKNNMKTQLSASLNWEEFNKSMNTVVMSDDYCTRRGAMARAAGMAAGVAAATVASPAYAAETKDVKMGTDAGGLQFQPAKVSICKGDSVKWINNKGGPHNVVFDEDAIPAGVNQEKISMDDQLGDEGDTFVMKFDVAGEYAYYCEPHRGAGMNGALVVA